MAKAVLGLIEEIAVFGIKKEQLRARIDTGATSSSMDITLAARLGLVHTSRTKVVKSASGVKRRPTAHAKVQIDGEIIEAEFTLADRSHMTYPMLIGQNILKKGHFLIDPRKGEQEEKHG